MQNEGEINTPAECPEGLDYRQLRAYVRSEEDGNSDSIPPWVRGHIDSCAICRPKWDFLRRSDPVVRKQFESRIGILMEQVNIQEVIFGPPLGPKPSAVPEPGLTPQGQAFVSGIQKSLLHPKSPAAMEPLYPGLSQDESGQLQPEVIVDIVNHIKQIADARERRFERQRVVKLFEQRLKKTVTQEEMYDVLAKLSASDNLEPLQNVTEVEIAVAGISETTELTDPPLLTVAGGHVFFNASLLRRLRNAVHA